MSGKFVYIRNKLDLVFIESRAADPAAFFYYYTGQPSLERAEDQFVAVDNIKACPVYVGKSVEK